MKTVAAAARSGSLTACGYRFMMYMQPPKDALTIERLYCHFIFQFDSGIAAADRVVQSIGILDETAPFPADTSANYQRRQTLNIQADSNRRVDIGIDLSHLLKNDNVRYEEVGFDSSDIDTGFTVVEILLPNTISFATTSGIIELWKQDGLYTTTGIR